MMMEKVHSHNEVNGFVFSASEFLLIALAITPFAIYYLTHGRGLFGAVTIGIMANSLTIVALSVRSLVARQRDIGVLRWFDQSGRAAIISKYPNISRDTIVLTLAVLFPFMLLCCVLYEQAFASRLSR